MTLVGKNTGFDDETTMDIETVHEIAPEAHLVFFNLNSVSDATSDADLFAQAFLKAEAQFPGAIMSMSLGECETDTQAFDRADLVALNSTVASIEAKGSTVFAASGDSGGLDCTPSADDGQPPQSSFEGVTVPASLPAVTGTGGTTLTTDAAGNYSRRDHLVRAAAVPGDRRRRRHRVLAAVVADGSRHRGTGRHRQWPPGARCECRLGPDHGQFHH